jgi:transposase-like protein
MDMRASDASRERTARLLGDRFADGCLGTDTFLTRLDATYRAVSAQELAAIVHDLPPAPSTLRRWLTALAEWTTGAGGPAGERRTREPEAAIEIELPDGAARPLVLGRSSRCHVVISDDTVSRVHAELEQRAGRWVIRDLGSTNGTWVNGRRIEIAALDEDDVLVLGTARARLSPQLPGAKR